jgi:hypothetical protein
MAMSSDVYLVVRGTVKAQHEPPGPNGRPERVVTVAYGNGRSLTVAQDERGVFLIPAEAARALAVCAP